VFCRLYTPNVFAGDSADCIKSLSTGYAHASA